MYLNGKQGCKCSGCQMGGGWAAMPPYCSAVPPTMAYSQPPIISACHSEDLPPEVVCVQLPKPSENFVISSGGQKQTLLVSAENQEWLFVLIS